MCQKDYNTKKRKWKQLTQKERDLIEHLYNVQKKNYTEIAKELNKHRTTISREIRLGLVSNLTSELVEVYFYSAQIAQDKNILNETAEQRYLKEVV